MITDKQVVNIIRFIAENFSILEPGRILTNSSRVLDAFTTLNNSHDIYYVTTNIEKATEAYKSKRKNESNVYFATVDQFVKEFKNFDCMIFDLKKISYETLALINGVVAHGAKNDCVLCIISPCEGVDKISDGIIDELVQKVCSVYNTTIPLSERLSIYLRSIHLKSISKPWYTDADIKRISKNYIKLTLPQILSASFSDGEKPHLNVRNQATLAFLVKYIARISIKTQNFQVPSSFMYVDDGKFSSGVVYFSKTCRSITSLSSKSYQHKCFEKITSMIPAVYTMTVNSFPKKRLAIETEEEKPKTKKISMLTKTGKSIEKLASQVNLREQLKQFLLSTLPTERLSEIFTEFNEWVEESGGENKIDIRMMTKKLSEYDELKEFVELLKESDATTKEKSDL